MQRRRIALTIGIAALLLVVYFTGILPIPRPARVLYWSLVFKITKPANDPVRLTAVHQATKVAVRGPNGTTYTYKYTKENRAVIESDSAKCIACHGPMVERGVSEEMAKNPIHQKMLTAPMLNFSCTDCHKQVDIRKRSPSHVTIQVDRSLCPKCHNPSRVALPAELTQGRTWGEADAPTMPPLMSLHGTDDKSGRQWIANHPRVGMAVGIQQCRQCHIPDSELDFCRVCHLRGGFRPSSHQAVYNVPVNQIYPGSPRTDIVPTKWKGYHFVVAREALAKLGVRVDSPKNLPLDKVAKLPCGACHVIEDWCTRCHIKHNPNWLDPNVGHPAYVAKYGTKYCFRCHDTSGSKCVTCHSFVGQLN